jgi:hypothetical protein
VSVVCGENIKKRPGRAFPQAQWVNRSIGVITP